MAWAHIACSPENKTMQVVGFSTGNYMNAKRLAAQAAQGRHTTAIRLPTKYIADPRQPQLLNWFIECGIEEQDYEPAIQAICRAITKAVHRV